MADLFSRLSYKEEKSKNTPEIFIASILASKPSKNLENALKNIEQLQTKDIEIQPMIENAKSRDIKHIHT